MTNQTTQPSNKISMDKKYKTRDGRDVIIESIDPRCRYPVTAIIAGNFISTTEDGFYYPDKSESPFDLIEIQEESSVSEETNDTQPTETQDQPTMYQMIVETPNKTFRSIPMTEEDANKLMNDIQEYLIKGSLNMLSIRESESTSILHGDVLKQSIISFVKVQG